jgi:hypothetical protein
MIVAVLTSDLSDGRLAEALAGPARTERRQPYQRSGCARLPPAIISTVILAIRWQGRTQGFHKRRPAGSAEPLRILQSTETGRSLSLRDGPQFNMVGLFA